MTGFGTGHKVMECEYGVVHQQCRCPGPHTVIKVLCDVPEEHSGSGSGSGSGGVTGDVKGVVLRLQNGLVVVPYEQVGPVAWEAVVVWAPEGPVGVAYPRGGYNIVVYDRDIKTATVASVRVGSGSGSGSGVGVGVVVVDAK